MLSRLMSRWKPAKAGDTVLDRGLLRWSDRDTWTVRDAIQGTLILGATGSGKTSGSGQAIARAFLAEGFGGLVLTAKSDERALWTRYLEEAGRSDDLVIFGADSQERFNFLHYEQSRDGAGAGITENLVNLFTTVLEVAERGSGGGDNREESGYWGRASRQLMRNGIDALNLSGSALSVPDLYRVVISAPQSTAQLQDDAWKARSFCFQKLLEAERRVTTPSERTDLEVVADYWLVEFPSLSEKTRSVVVATFTSMADVLNRGLLRELFSGETTLSPDAVAEGKIVLLDLPVKEFGEVGLFAQVIWKHVFQRAIERRRIEPGTSPVFLWADEAQHFVTSGDMAFQTTCRSARVATVLLTQNVSNVYAALGGSEKGRSEAASLFANLTTKVLHSSGDPVTNDWAASLVGRSLQCFASGSNGTSQPDGVVDWLGTGSAEATRSSNGGFSESYEYELQPAAFTRLATGGPGNEWKVEGIVMQSGRMFEASGTTWLPVAFPQRGEHGGSSRRRRRHG